jgi:hypothetical protein
MRIGIWLGASVVVALGTVVGIAAYQHTTPTPALTSQQRMGTAPSASTHQVSQDAQISLALRKGHGASYATHRQPTPPPVLGSWRWMGTAPSGFVRQGTQEAQVTLTFHQGQVRGLVATGRYRYAADAHYTASQKQLQLTFRTGQGSVRVEATLLKGNQRMISTWYDAHGDDGGFVLVRTTVAALRIPARR